MSGIPRIPGNLPINRSVVDPPSSFSPLKDLPRDIIYEIFLRMRLEDIFACGSTDRHFNQLTQKNELWLILHNRDFSPHLARDFSQGYKSAYVDCSRFEFNITRKTYTYYNLKDTSDSDVINHCIASFEDKLIIGNSKMEIEIWNGGTGDLLCTLRGHLSKLRALCVYNRSLFSIDAEGIIKIWDIETETYRGEIQERMEYLCSFFISNERLFIAGGDGNFGIKSWDLKTWKPLEDFFLGDDPHWIVAYEGNLIVCHHEYDIQIIEIKTGEKIGSFEGIEDHHPIAGVCFDGKLILSCGDFQIQIWDIATQKYLGAFDEEHTQQANKMVIFNGMLVSLSNKEMKIWNIETKKCINTFPYSIADVVMDMVASDGRLAFLFKSRCKIANFWERHCKIFAELVRDFRSDKEEDVEYAMFRFSKMPINTRNKIYNIFNNSIGLTPFISINRSQNPWFAYMPPYEESSAFHDLHGLSSRPDEKAAAIETYIAENEWKDWLNPGKWVDPKGNFKRQRSS